MRFMMLVHATKETEEGAKPSPELAEAMMKYNEELATAGALVAAEGLYPGSAAVRVSYSAAGGKPKIIDGPFTEAKEIIAGFTIIEVDSKEEAIEWAKRMPNPYPSGEGSIELRQIFEAPEISDQPDWLAREIEMRENVTRKGRL